MRLSKENIGAMNMIYAHHSWQAFLDSMERLGIRQFELFAPTPHFDVQQMSQEDISNFKAELERRNMRITCLTPEQCNYPHNLAARNCCVRQEAIAYFKDYMMAAKKLGIDKMLVSSGWGDVDEDIEDAWKRSMESLRELIAFAEEIELNLVFEILNEYETNLANCFENMKRVIKEVNSPCLKFCIDTVPVELEHKTLEEYFRTFTDRIIHIHMTDGDPLGHIPPGLGRYDMAEYFKVLEKYDYTGFVTIEIADTTWSNEPEKATKIGYETLCSALDKAHTERT